jgi:hypothetical protein
VDGPIRIWFGKADGLPAFVVARMQPSVGSVIAIDDHGLEHELTVTAVIEQFNLRFGALAVPEDSSIVRVLYENAGTPGEIKLRHQEGLPSSGGHGWRPSPS